MDELSPEQPVIRDVVLDVQLPQTTPTSRVQVRRIRMLPDYPAGLHIHNGPVVGSILKGSVVYQVEGEPQSVLSPGDVFYEREVRASPASTLVPRASRSSPISCSEPAKSRRSNFPASNRRSLAL